MNRTTDGRFKDERAIVDSNKLQIVLEDIKNEKSWTWKEFADSFGVSAHTLRHDWRKDADSIPLSVARKLDEMSKIDLDFKTKSAWHGQKKGGRKSGMRGNIPDWSLEFAELYGALLGDGCVYSNFNSFCITGNADLDEEYIRYLSDLCNSVFDIDPKIRFQREETVVRLTLNSRKIARFLVDTGFPLGKKKNKNFSPPEDLTANKELLASCVRGLFDTDGGIYSHPNTGIMLDITAKNESLLRFLNAASDRLDLPLNLTTGRVQLYGESKVEEFLKNIGSSNSRNIKRYLYYKENGNLPPVTSETLLRSRSQDFDVPYFGFMV